MSEMINVLLVDDHTLFRKGLAELLENSEQLHVVGMAANQEEALDAIAELNPQVVLSDLSMPPSGGLTLLRQLSEQDWQGILLILTVSDSEEDMTAALRSGAQGYLLKDMEPDELVEAVLRAVKGEIAVAPSMTNKLLQSMQNPVDKKEDGLKQLTAREREILDCLAQGLSNKLIARALNISLDTVKLHVRHILAKLDFTSRVEAAVFAVAQDKDKR